MNRSFEQVGPIKRIISRNFYGEDFENMVMEQLDISELSFAADTLIFAAPGHSLDAFVCAIEAVSSVYGLRLNLNRDKYAKL